MKSTAVVVGAGVIGLTSAIRLLEAGVPTEVWTADEPQTMTSYAAGASWGPHLVTIDDAVTAWGIASLAVHRELVTDPGSGVRIGEGIEASSDLMDVPAWAEPLGEITMCGPDDLPPGFRSGWRHRTPLIDMPVHLGYLGQRYLDAGGPPIVHRRVAALSDVDAPIVVNCTGMGARELVPDVSMVPVRGQIVVVENPGITEFFVAASGELTYFFPHGDTVVLGGQALAGSDDRPIDPELAAQIVQRCAAVEPRLRDARVIEHRVGFRPTRPVVRLERDGNVIHNYGHGGAGVTLSWGCADTVVRLVTGNG